MTNLCKEYDKFLSENDERFKKLSKENQFYINAIGYGVKYYDLQQRIDKALKYLKRLQEKEIITEFETELLIELLEGDEK